MNDELKQKLECWEVDPAVPGGFQREVWQRIATREGTRPHSGWWQFGRSCFEMLATPRYGAAVLVTSVLIGAGAARVEANQENARRWNDLQVRYITTIDPVAQAIRP